MNNARDEWMSQCRNPNLKMTTLPTNPIVPGSDLMSSHFKAPTFDWKAAIVYILHSSQQQEMTNSAMLAVSRTLEHTSFPLATCLCNSHRSVPSPSCSILIVNRGIWSIDYSFGPLVVLAISSSARMRVTFESHWFTILTTFGILHNSLTAMPSI